MTIPIKNTGEKRHSTVGRVLALHTPDFLDPHIFLCELLGVIPGTELGITPQDHQLWYPSKILKHFITSNFDPISFS